MENILYRLTTSMEDSSLKEKELYLDYLDYEEALSNYNHEITSKTSTHRTADSMMGPYLLVQNDYESNASGQWHWCNLKTDKGNIFTMKIEPIQFFEARYFASEDIRARYEAIYGNSGSASGFFTRLFKRKK